MEKTDSWVCGMWKISSYHESDKSSTLQRMPDQDCYHRGKRVLQQLLQQMCPSALLHQMLSEK